MSESTAGTGTVDAGTGGAPGAPAALAVLRFSPDGERTLGHELVEPTAPIVGALDLSATRGDGIFETISTGHGHPQAFDAHLARFARSAAMLELRPPDLDAWRAAVVATADAVGPVAEGFVKIVLSRGVEGSGVPTGWAYATESPDHTPARTTGIRVLLLDRGVRHDLAASAPWLLLGAKTLSYAMNRAAAREAARRGADDALFVSSDGYLMEGPTSNVVVLHDGRLRTPPLDSGILAGTTQADVFAWAQSRGMPTAYEPLTPRDLLEADAAWMVSSVRHAAAIRGVVESHAPDQVPDQQPAGLSSELPVDRVLSDAMNAFLRGRTA